MTLWTVVTKPIFGLFLGRSVVAKPSVVSKFSRHAILHSN